LGNLEKGSSAVDFESWMKGGSGDGASLFEEAPWRGPWGSSFTGDSGIYVKKVSGYGHLSPRGI
jgi:hypothetical protein